MISPVIKTMAASALAMGLIGVAGSASAETNVDFTVAEYSSKTGPYFEEVAAAFEAVRHGRTAEMSGCTAKRARQSFSWRPVLDHAT